MPVGTWLEELEARVAEEEAAAELDEAADEDEAREADADEDEADEADVTEFTVCDTSDGTTAEVDGTDKVVASKELDGSAEPDDAALGPVDWSVVAGAEDPAVLPDETESDAEGSAWGEDVTDDDVTAWLNEPNEWAS